MDRQKRFGVGRVGVESDAEAVKVAAAVAGDAAAREQVLAAHLPLVYNVVGRALGGHADVDDVVQETMVRALRGLDDLRDPGAFRSWLIAIAMNQVRRHWSAGAWPPVDGLDAAREVADPRADFVELTILRLGLSGQRREVAEATRWLDAEDRELLALWWLEAAGEITRPELADALGIAPAHAAVRVQRMKERLEAGRLVVRALAALPGCPDLTTLTTLWDGAPSALWRKRMARHVRGCAGCSGRSADLVPAEGLLARLSLVPVPFALSLPEPAGSELLHVAGSTPTDPTGPSLTGSTATDPAGPPVPEGAAPSEPYAFDSTSTAPPPYGSGQAVPDAFPDASRPYGPEGAPTNAADGPSPMAAEDTGPLPGPSHAAPRGSRARPGRRPRTSTVVAVAALLAAATTVVLRPWEPGEGPRAQRPGDGGPQPTAPAPTSVPSAPQGTPTPSAETSTASPPASKKSPTQAAPSRPAGRERPSVEQQVLDLVNAERRRAGCGPVRTDAQLHRAAQRHANDMAARGYVEHTSPEGVGPGERISAAGYEWSAWAENIHRGPKTAGAAVDDWMGDAGHRDNILNCRFTHMGLGFTTGAGGPWWTQDFAAR